MNKVEFIEFIAKKHKISSLNAKQLLEIVLRSLQEVLAERGVVKISGFGNFAVKDRAAKIGRNPATGEKMQIPAGKSVSFRAGAETKKLVSD
ncbi:HU family DNA-binding protein [Rickettsia endosymbiont of Cardiosporidium cionae]|uniref:HU family DNA-binding protein n=1 Tax=Rickettsia endosymbiont of Cardiosporidium cionae TaxID=2777155 RepID=UPI00189359B0|nr:HU family DNA-binding protein [Rickettsia endosymbiont of Cardiosporidium cionae]KAF8818018.1 HU family DNA-binding protein [Rickettsia endosymbiont of Cardiosporidium cionae]